ncbi:hypothetical protein C8R47DRAFT_1165451 [Mycena vitilis]|nr:hypothetical protein C8R47DRAFT_1165451 [Mycena vitilis]
MTLNLHRGFNLLLSCTFYCLLSGCFLVAGCFCPATFSTLHSTLSQRTCCAACATASRTSSYLQLPPSGSPSTADVKKSHSVDVGKRGSVMDKSGYRGAIWCVFDNSKTFWYLLCVLRSPSARRARTAMPISANRCRTRGVAGAAAAVVYPAVQRYHGHTPHPACTSNRPSNCARALSLCAATPGRWCPATINVRFTLPTGCSVAPGLFLRGHRLAACPNTSSTVVGGPEGLRQRCANRYRSHHPRCTAAPRSRAKLPSIQASRSAIRRSRLVLPGGALTSRYERYIPPSSLCRAGLMPPVCATLPCAAACSYSTRV